RKLSAAFSAEIEAKRLLLRWALGGGGGCGNANTSGPAEQKFFARFFSKKRRLLPAGLPFSAIFAIRRPSASCR
ncbi:MAG: hypothetical protein B7Z81_10595, partial [Acidocella sp. 20-61-6]